MSDLQVTAADVAQAAEELHALAEELRSGMAHLDNEVDTVIGGSWSGEASAAFGAIWREWHAGATQITDALTILSTLLAGAASGYGQTDATAADALGSDM